MNGPKKWMRQGGPARGCSRRTAKPKRGDPPGVIGCRVKGAGKVSVILRFLERTAMAIAVASVVAMMLVVSYDAISRYAFNKPLPWSFNWSPTIYSRRPSIAQSVRLFATAIMSILICSCPTCPRSSDGCSASSTLSSPQRRSQQSPTALRTARMRPMRDESCCLAIRLAAVAIAPPDTDRRSAPRISIAASRVHIGARRAHRSEVAAAGAEQLE